MSSLNSRLSSFALSNIRAILQSS